MRRRLFVVLSAVLAVALAVTAVALAGGGSGSKRSQSDRDGAGHGLRADGRHGGRGLHRGGPEGPAGFLGHGIMGMVLDSLAGRLDVKPADLRTAVEAVGKEQRDKQLAAAGLSPAEIDALKACGPRHFGLGEEGNAASKRAAKRAAAGACDRDAARAAFDKLRKAPKPDLAALKADVAASLATKLGKTPEQVLTAVRAELEQRLGQAVAIGFVTQKGSDLALACFDDPAKCDLEALKAEVHFGHGARGARHP